MYKLNLDGYVNITLRYWSESDNWDSHPVSLDSASVIISSGLALGPAKPVPTRYGHGTEVPDEIRRSLESRVRTRSYLSLILIHSYKPMVSTTYFILLFDDRYDICGVFGQNPD